MRKKAGQGKANCPCCVNARAETQMGFLQVQAVTHDVLSLAQGSWGVNVLQACVQPTGTGIRVRPGHSEGSLGSRKGRE